MRFYRVAEQKLTAASVLRDNGLFRDATYLAGYGFECGLKCLILKWTPPSGHQQFIDDRFRGARAHDFSFLLELLRINRVSLPVPQRRQVVRAGAIWTVDLRYQPGKGRADEADELIVSATAFLEWVKGKMQ